MHCTLLLLTEAFYSFSLSRLFQYHNLGHISFSTSPTTSITASQLSRSPAKSIECITELDENLQDPSGFSAYFDKSISLLPSNDSSSVIDSHEENYFSYQPATSALEETPVSPAESILSISSFASSISSSVSPPCTTIQASADHPLLAARDYDSCCTAYRYQLPSTSHLFNTRMSSRNSSSGSFFQQQNQAAYGYPASPASLRKHSSADSNSSSGSESGSDKPARASIDSRMSRPSVQLMRCSRCAKCVETISQLSSDGLRRVSTDDASASGMVRWGHNLYYCDRCAAMVGYK